jgi:hypothetical protein
MRLSKAMEHALALLEIQDAKRGWARFMILSHAGVKMETLRSLQRRKLLEAKFPSGSPVGSRDALMFRLTGTGEKLAGALKLVAPPHAHEPNHAPDPRKMVTILFGPFRIFQHCAHALGWRRHRETEYRCPVCGWRFILCTNRDHLHGLPRGLRFVTLPRHFTLSRWREIVQIAAAMEFNVLRSDVDGDDFGALRAIEPHAHG